MNFAVRDLWRRSMFLGALKIYQPKEFPPYFGEWGYVDSDGALLNCGRVGPFDTSDEAFRAAAEAASKAGARKMPLDGFAQVVDSRGNPAGPIV